MGLVCGRWCSNEGQHKNENSKRDNRNSNYSIQKNNLFSQQNMKHVAKLQDYEIQKLIGKGAFSKVHLYKNQQNGEYFAIKEVKKEFLSDFQLQKNAISEKQILLAMNGHPFIVKLHHTFQTKQKLYFVLDYLNGGDLLFHLSKVYRNQFSEETARFYIAELILAVEHLHKHKIIHRDLKPENILITNDGHIKLTDFGMSKIMNQPTTMSHCGTRLYMAPEIYYGEQYSYAVDYYSIGIILYEMLCSKTPFQTFDFKSNERQVMQQRKINDSYQYRKQFSNDAQNLLQNLLKTNPTERISDMETLKSHKFFKQIKWRDLLSKKIKPPLKPKQNQINVDSCFYKLSLKDTECKIINDSIYNGFSQVCSQFPQDKKSLDFKLEIQGIQSESFTKVQKTKDINYPNQDEILFINQDTDVN